MMNKILTLVGLTLSLSANAAIVDMGNITRDTATGLDWLDLTETNGRSYNDISSKLGAGQEFDGWRYASVTEVQVLWSNLGMSNGTNESLLTSDVIYGAFVSSVNIIGNTANTVSDFYDYGAMGITGDTASDTEVFGAGISHWIGNDFTNNWAEDKSVLRTRQHNIFGSYLVAPSAVPVPAAGWLFMTALVGLVGKKRLSR